MTSNWPLKWLKTEIFFKPSIRLKKVLNLLTSALLRHRIQDKLEKEDNFNVAANTLKEFPIMIKMVADSAVLIKFTVQMINNVAAMEMLSDLMDLANGH